MLIAHVAAHTERRSGSAPAAIMLPNHAPLVIAEQFGTLATLHPGRIDLGLGRAPGTDQDTMRALRRDAAAGGHVPAGRRSSCRATWRRDPRSRACDAIPGQGTNVPLYILGSSLFGAQLAAALGLPYAFASHFAPAALRGRGRVYRERVPALGAARPRRT